MVHEWFAMLGREGGSFIENPLGFWSNGCNLYRAAGFGGDVCSFG